MPVDTVRLRGRCAFDFPSPNLSCGKKLGYIRWAVLSDLDDQKASINILLNSFDTNCTKT
jgi:hypothetical protein